MGMRYAAIVCQAMSSVTAGRKATFASAAPFAISVDSTAGKALKAPDKLSWEDRLNARPLDWNVTRGKPSRQPLTPEEQSALRDAELKMSDSGASAPEAAEEAGRLIPDEEKAQEKA